MPNLSVLVPPPSQPRQQKPKNVASQSAHELERLRADLRVIDPVQVPKAAASMSSLHGRMDLRSSRGSLAGSASGSLLPLSQSMLRPPTGAQGTLHGQINPYGLSRPGTGNRPISRYGRDLRGQYRRQLAKDETTLGRSLVHNLPAIVDSGDGYDLCGALVFDLSRLMGKPRPGRKPSTPARSFRIVREDADEF